MSETPETTTTPTTETPTTTAEPVAAPTPAPTVVSDPVTEKLRSLGVTDEAIVRLKEKGADTLEDLDHLTEKHLSEAGVKELKISRILAKLKPPAPTSTNNSATVNAIGAVSFASILPAVPNEDSWLTALRTGGVLKVDQSTVISAIRAALAYRAGLYGIPDRLVKLMEQFADESIELVDTEFFRLRRELTRRTYAEIFEAIDGLDGTYVTEGRKKQLFQRIDQHLWPAIMNFFEQLKSWQEAWMQGSANPMMQFQMLSAFVASTGGGVGAMPPGMLQPPDTGAVRDSADAVSDSVNKVFAGTGVQIAAALAYDASKIKSSLENPRLPALIGAANRDLMLQKLGVAVSATYPRLETNLTQFVLAIIHLKDQPAGNEELQYLGALFMLGSQIPWSQLGESPEDYRITGIGGSRPHMQTKEILPGVSRMREIKEDL